ncbi:hypothetical protein BD847_0748 [Flavobacterium cutihirudinis]|uniref:Uncharacterized protein n=2 Tax=Flavobacterium cutihirudinis TaxID=1265740 RepID=A0A3D9G114_9FLAO|nr:hypothetical protein BD847_0748 [Flavobacterium cutihirudinis]
MLHTIKNSILCKCVHALLIGYFLMSSINMSGTFSRLINNYSVENTFKGMTCNLLKKIFKCDGIPEELDDYETKDTKTTKLAKGIPLLEYLVPIDASVPGLYFKMGSKGKNYIDNPIFSFGFHGKIHLRPPRVII